MSTFQIKSALISVFNKEKLSSIVPLLAINKVKIYSTKGSAEYIKKFGIEAVLIEELTNYPSIFGGRVKTLHPVIFGSILYRRTNKSDISTANQYEIPKIDMVIVDLYDFEKTVASQASNEDIIEKIDIGGVSLIRAAAKNYADVLVVSSQEQYPEIENIFTKQNGYSTLEERKTFACKAFEITSHYDAVIYNYFNHDIGLNYFKSSIRNYNSLRYGENPHQNAGFYGDLKKMFHQLNGKEISYNNLVDIDAAISLIEEFEETTFVIMKHTNACGVASGSTLEEAFQKALACDSLSAFGGVLVCNRTVDMSCAKRISKLFFEILVSPAYDNDALELLSKNKTRILLKQKLTNSKKTEFKSILNGIIEQDRNKMNISWDTFEVKTNLTPNSEQKKAMVFANKIVKHSKSNAIILSNENQLFGSGIGQTSRIDALLQAIEKAKRFKFNLNNSVLASDGFFPFSDCVEIAHKEGIKAIIQPGGSKRDLDSINFCNENDLTMAFTGIRHFKH